MFEAVGIMQYEQVSTAADYVQMTLTSGPSLTSLSSHVYVLSTGIRIRSSERCPK